MAQSIVWIVQRPWVYVGMKYWWNHTDKLHHYKQKCLSQCHFVHRKSHIDLTGKESIPPRWQAGRGSTLWTFKEPLTHTHTHTHTYPRDRRRSGKSGYYSGTFRVLCSAQRLAIALSRVVNDAGRSSPENTYVFPLSPVMTTIRVEGRIWCLNEALVCKNNNGVMKFKLLVWDSTERDGAAWRS